MLNSNITPFLLLAVSVGLFYTYINPNYIKVKELRAEAAEYEEAMGRVGEIQSIRDDLLVRLNSIPPDDLARLNTFLPDNVDDVRLVLDIDGIAKKYGIGIGNIKITKPVIDNQQLLEGAAPSASYQNEQLSFTFMASYEDFNGFIKEIEQSLRIMDVMNISIRPGNETGGTYEYTVIITTYWME